VSKPHPLFPMKLDQITHQETRFSRKNQTTYMG